MAIHIKKRAIVLLSGGLDSATCLKIALQDYYSPDITTLSISYGQKHAVEIHAARSIARRLNIDDHRELTLPSDLFKGANSALVDESVEVPDITYEETIKAKGTSPMYVPYRNGTFLSIAASLALQIGAERIYYGAHAEDARNFAYPDCTAEFNGAMANAIYAESGYAVRLITPLQWMTKKDVVRTAIELCVPIKLTYSCYKGGKKACGKCATCVSRIAAFKELRVMDPIDYEIDIDWGYTSGF